MSEARSVEVVQEVRIAAPPPRVWRALVAETGRWWPAGFYARPEAKAMVFEARLGGRQYEDWGDGQGLLWAQVVGIKENELLLMAGELFPEYGGPARLLTTYTLKADGEGTLLRLRDCAFGAVGEKLGRNLDAGWKTLLSGALKPYVEGGGS